MNYFLSNVILYLRHYKNTKKMIKKGILLAGGLGTRMGKCTSITNKHLLPIYDKPMIEYPLNTIRQIGITELLIITGDKSANEIMKYIGNGSQFGFEFVYYATQNGNGGIAEAISLGKSFTNGDPFCVILGDNILDNHFKINFSILSEFITRIDTALVCFKKTLDNSKFGVPEFDENYKLLKIAEKPTVPKSEFAQIGIYFYHSNVYKNIKKLTYSQRDELEVTDLNNLYLLNNALCHCIIPENTFWSDAGTTDTLIYCNNYVKNHLTDF
jgi:glucose-1-phosphate thymidylyltransferase